MELIGFDSEGRRKWCLPADDENTRFPHEANIGLLSNGDVAVLDNSILSYTRLGLQVFDPAGNEIRKIDLGAKWIFATPYNILAIDQRDRFIIATPYEKRATIRRVCSDGSEDFAITPRLSNGYEIKPIDGARISQTVVSGFAMESRFFGSMKRALWTTLSARSRLTRY